MAFGWGPSRGNGVQTIALVNKAIFFYLSLMSKVRYKNFLSLRTEALPKYSFTLKILQLLCDL